MISNRNHRDKVGLFLAVLFTMAMALGLAAPSFGQTLEQKLDEYLQAAQRIQHFRGAVLVAKGSEVVLSKGYGFADARAATKNFDYTKFLIGSVTKQFTAAALLQLAEEGKLNLNDPIGKFLPDYPGIAAEKVTIHHLLTHTSGIPNYTELVDVVARRHDPITVPELLYSFDTLPLQFEPGSTFKYSNSGYEVLGAIIEKVSGQSYASYLRNHILKPAGMNNTGISSDPGREVGMATGYAPDSSGQLSPLQYVHGSFAYAAGAIYSTVQDMYRWDQALRGEKILSRESMARMFAPFKEHYGYGWMIDTLYGHQMVTHDGSIDGFASSFLRFVDEPYCVVVLSNSEQTQVNAISAALTAVVYEQPYDLPVKKTPVAIDPAGLDDYVGAYEIAPEAFRLITREGDSLFSKRSGSARIRLFPEAKDRFFFEHDNAVTLTFVRDSAGRVASHIIHQRGADVTAKRVEGERAAQLMEMPSVATVDPSVYDRYAGQYELAPGFVLTVRKDGGRIFTQATGQQEVEIFPKSETQFFLKVVDAQITFVKDPTGAVGSLVLHQGGRDMPAKKIK